MNLNQLQNHLDRLKAEVNLPQEMVLVACKHERLGHAIGLVIEGKREEKTDFVIEKYQRTVLPFSRISHQTLLKKIPRTTLRKPILDRIRIPNNGDEKK